MAAPIFRKRLLKSYLCRVRLVRCEIFADSSLLGGLFYLRGLLFPRPPPEGPVPPPCPVGHPAPCRFVVVPYWASFYLVLPLSLITRDMPATAFGAAVNVHRDARCEPALIGDHASFVFGKVKVLFLAVFTATGTHGYLSPFLALAS